MHQLNIPCLKRPWIKAIAMLKKNNNLFGDLSMDRSFLSNDQGKYMKLKKKKKKDLLEVNFRAMWIISPLLVCAPFHEFLSLSLAPSPLQPICIALIKGSWQRQQLCRRPPTALRGVWMKHFRCWAQALRSGRSGWSHAPLQCGQS